MQHWNLGIVSALGAIFAMRLGQMVLWRLAIRFLKHRNFSCSTSPQLCVKAPGLVKIENWSTCSFGVLGKIRWCCPNREAGACTWLSTVRRPLDFGIHLGHFLIQKGVPVMWEGPCATVVPSCCDCLSTASTRYFLLNPFIMEKRRVWPSESRQLAMEYIIYEAWIVNTFSFL